MSLFAPVDFDTVCFVKALLCVAAIGCSAVLYLARRHNLANARRAVLIVLFTLAPLSLFAYHNLGKLHGTESINVYDAYHYYMGAKYFRELGYWHLYEATVVASDEADLATVRRVQMYRDQRDYKTYPRRAAYANADRWRERFTPERWESFKEDLRFFAARASSSVWSRMLVDKGYNPTPVWTLLGKPLATLVPARAGPGMVILCYLDLLFIAGIVAALWWAFGTEVALLSAVFIGVNFTTPFGPIGGALLRWDYCLWLVLSLCLMKKDRPLWSGAFLAYAALLRVSPAVFGFGVAVTAGYAFVQALWRERGVRRSAKGRQQTPGTPLRNVFDDLRGRGAFRAGLLFAVGGTAATLVLVLLTLVLIPEPVQSWDDWAEKMGIHQHSLGTKRYGLKYVFSYEGEVSRGDLGLEDGGWDGRDARKQALLAQTAGRRLAVNLLVVAWFVVAAYRRRPWEAMALASVFILLLSPTRYYYAQLVALVPLLAYEWRNPGRLAGLSLLFLSMLAMYFFYDFQKEYAFMQFVVSVALCVVYLYLLVWFAYEPGGEDMQTGASRRQKTSQDGSSTVRSQKIELPM